MIEEAENGQEANHNRQLRCVRSLSAAWWLSLGMRGGDAPALVVAQGENQPRLYLAHVNRREVYLLLLAEGRQSAAVRVEHQAQAPLVEPGVLGSNPAK